MLSPESIASFSSNADGISYHGRLNVASTLFVTARIITMSLGEALLTLYFEQSKTGDGWHVVSQRSQVIAPGVVASLTVPVVGPEHVRTRLAIAQGAATASILANAVARGMQPVFRLPFANMLKPGFQLPTEGPSPWTMTF